MEVSKANQQLKSRGKKQKVISCIISLAFEVGRFKNRLYDQCDFDLCLHMLMICQFSMKWLEENPEISWCTDDQTLEQLLKTVC